MCRLNVKEVGEPVKMVITREEAFMATRSRHPFIRDSEIGLKRMERLLLGERK
jgi:CO/xanthine dehydrogenase Mo-binding subunit